MLVTPANLSYSKFAAYKKQKAKSPGRWVNERAGLLASAWLGRPYCLWSLLMNKSPNSMAIAIFFQKVMMGFVGVDIWWVDNDGACVSVTSRLFLILMLTIQADSNLRLKTWCWEYCLDAWMLLFNLLPSMLTMLVLSELWAGCLPNEYYQLHKLLLSILRSSYLFESPHTLQVPPRHRIALWFGLCSVRRLSS
jgi:hypothetical protein